jgi:hypothetical protein
VFFHVQGMWSEKHRFQENLILFFIPCLHGVCSILQKLNFNPFPSNTAERLLCIKRTDIPHGVASDHQREVTKPGVSNFTRSVLSDARELKRGLSVKEDLGEKRPFSKGLPLQNDRRLSAIGGIRKAKGTEVSRSVPAWGPPQRPDLRK